MRWYINSTIDPAALMDPDRTARGQKPGAFLVTSCVAVAVVAVVQGAGSVGSLGVRQGERSRSSWLNGRGGRLIG